MFCKNCGTECSNSAFCPNCGTRVDAPTQAPVQPAAPAYRTPPVQKSNPGIGSGIASMILGILSLVVLHCSCFYYIAIITIPLAFILGIISAALGKSGLRASEEAGFSNGPARTGKVISTITIVITSVILGLCALLITFFCVFACITGFVDWNSFY